MEDIEYKLKISKYLFRLKGNGNLFLFWTNEKESIHIEKKSRLNHIFVWKKEEKLGSDFKLKIGSNLCFPGYAYTKESFCQRFFALASIFRD